MNVTIGIHQFLMNIRLANPPTNEMVKALNKAIRRGLIFLVSNIDASYGKVASSRSPVTSQPFLCDYNSLRLDYNSNLYPTPFTVVIQSIPNFWRILRI
jgi:hypothetical protein